MVELQCEINISEHCLKSTLYFTLITPNRKLKWKPNWNNRKKKSCSLKCKFRHEGYFNLSFSKSFKNNCTIVIHFSSTYLQFCILFAMLIQLKHSKTELEFTKHSEFHCTWTAQNPFRNFPGWLEDSIILRMECLALSTSLYPISLSLPIWPLKANKRLIEISKLYVWTQYFSQLMSRVELALLSAPVPKIMQHPAKTNIATWSG